MTPQQTLEKIIEKAVKGGWLAPKSYASYEAIYVEEDKSWIWRASFDDYYNVEKFFFDHSFAKAYFGEKDICISCNKESGQDFFEHERQTKCNADYEAWYTLPAWMEHIQRLALTPPEERLSYLSKYL